MFNQTNQFLINIFIQKAHFLSRAGAGALDLPWISRVPSTVQDTQWPGWGGHLTNPEPRSPFNFPSIPFSNPVLYSGKPEQEEGSLVFELRELEFHPSCSLLTDILAPECLHQASRSLLVPPVHYKGPCLGSHSCHPTRGIFKNQSTTAFFH